MEGHLGGFRSFPLNMRLWGLSAWVHLCGGEVPQQDAAGSRGSAVVAGTGPVRLPSGCLPLHTSAALCLHGLSADCVLMLLGFYSPMVKDGISKCGLNLHLS